VCSVADVGRKELQEPDVGAVGGGGDLGGEHGSEWMGKRSEPVHGSASLDCRGSAKTIVTPLLIVGLGNFRGLDGRCWIIA
jgi:hypothetical protein